MELHVVELVILFDELANPLGLSQSQLKQVHIGIDCLRRIAGQIEKKIAAMGCFSRQFRADNTAALDLADAGVVAVVNLVADGGQPFRVIVEKRRTAGVIGRNLAATIREDQYGSIRAGQIEHLTGKLIGQQFRPCQ